MKKLLTALMPLLVLALVACGGENDVEEESAPVSAETNGETVNIKAMNWGFDQEEYSVPAGDVTITLESIEGNHGITIENTDVAINGDGSFDATLEPGEYQILCNVHGNGHNEMSATLVVT
ncbi:hypothetical protein [Shouchella shacheensis]|uniref:hypothetical protein n=1 Tax=Shouchella shacheensis TaxID=1649580 RepID=UPI000740544B|nr:hypothetical protein [Shouchella shacheensis]